jgi:peptidoglycan/LPS O-acetylase OafA/YrhL
MPFATQLWTIPVELRCSFVTWTVVLGLSKTRSIIRMTIRALLCLYLYTRYRPHESLFITGAILAEMYLRREGDNDETGKNSTREKLKSGIMFACALFFLSYPRRGGETALGWALLSKLGRLFVNLDEGETLPIYFFPHIGATLLGYSVSQSETLLQPLFTTPLARYLGKISFALYCVHTPLLNWIGYRMFIFWTTSVFGYNLGWLVGFAILSVVVVFAADLFTRAVDQPCIRLARWLQIRCLDYA